MPQTGAEELRLFAERVLTAAGLAVDDVPATAEGLVAASVRGVDSHGVFRLPQYVDCLQRDEINPRPRVRVVDRHGATALVDADGGYGFRPSLLAVQVAVEIATSMGVGLVGVRNSHHFGGAGHLVIALDLGTFVEPARFYEGVERLVAQIKAVPLAEGAKGVFLPGEPEWNTAQVRRSEGVPVSEELAERLVALAKELGIEGPRWR